MGRQDIDSLRDEKIKIKKKERQAAEYARIGDVQTQRNEQIRQRHPEREVQNQNANTQNTPEASLSANLSKLLKLPKVASEYITSAGFSTAKAFATEPEDYTPLIGAARIIADDYDKINRNILNLVNEFKDYYNPDIYNPPEYEAFKSQYEKLKKDLADKQNALKGFIEKNKDEFNDDFINQFLGSVDTLSAWGDTQLDTLNNQYGELSNYYGQFADEADYDRYIKTVGKYDKMSVAELETEADRLREKPKKTIDEGTYIGEDGTEYYNWQAPGFQAEWQSDKSENEKKQQDIAYIERLLSARRYTDLAETLSPDDIKLLNDIYYFKTKQQEAEKDKSTGAFTPGDGMTGVTLSATAKEYGDKYREAYAQAQKRFGANVNAYVDAVTAYRDMDAYDKNQAQYAQYAQEHPVAATMESVFMSPFRAVDTLIGAGVSGGESLKNPYSPLNYNTQRTDAIRSGVTNKVYSDALNKTGSKTWAKICSVGYSGLTAAAESAFTTLLTGGYAGAGSAVSKISKVLTPLAFSTNAAIGTYYSALERGIDYDKAAVSALFSGLAEFVFERVSIERLNVLKPKDVAVTFRDILINTGKQTLTEGSEEVFADIANAISDRLINGGLSEYALNIRDYMDDGKTEDEARRLAGIDFAKQLGESFLAGGLAGGISGAVVSTSGKAAYDAAQRAHQATIKENRVTVDKTRIGSEAFRSLFKTELDYAQKGNSKMTDLTAHRTIHRATPFGYAENGDMYVQTDKGNVRRLSEIKFSSYDQAKVYKFIESSGDIASARLVLAAYEKSGIRADGFMHGFGSYYAAADAGFDFKTADSRLGDYYAYLPTEVKKLAFEVATMRKKNIAAFIENEAKKETAPGAVPENATATGLENATVTGTEKVAGTTAEASNLLAMETQGSAEGVDVWKTNTNGESWNAGVTVRRAEKGALPRQTATELKILDAVGKKTGLSYVIVDALTDSTGNKLNAARFAGTKTVVLALNAEGGLLTRAAGHETFHYLKEAASESTAGLQEFVLNKLKENTDYDYNARIEALRATYGDDVATINEEIAANAMFEVFSNENFVREYALKDVSGAKKVLAYIRDFLAKVRNAIRGMALGNAEIQALSENEKLLNDIAKRFATILREVESGKDTTPASTESTTGTEAAKTDNTKADKKRRRKQRRGTKNEGRATNTDKAETATKTETVSEAETVNDEPLVLPEKKQSPQPEQTDIEDAKEALQRSVAETDTRTVEHGIRESKQLNAVTETFYRHAKGTLSRIKSFANVTDRIIDNYAKEIKNKTGSEVQLRFLADSLRALYSNIAETKSFGDGGLLRSAATIAQSVINNTDINSGIMDTQLWDESRAVRAFISKSRVTISDDAKQALAEEYGGTAAFRKNVMGRFILQNEGGMSADELYKQLNKLAPEWFSAEKNKTEVQQIQSILDWWQVIKPQPVGDGYLQTETERVQNLTMDILGKYYDICLDAAQKDKTIDRKTADVIERIKNDFTVQLERYRKTQEQEYKKATSRVAFLQEKLVRDRGKKHRAEQNDKLRSMIGRLGADMRRSSKDKVVPKALYDSISRLCDKFLHVETRDENVIAEINNVRVQYDNIRASNSTIVAGAWDLGIANSLKTLSDDIGDKNTRDFTASELKRMRSVLTEVITSVNNANKMFKQGRYELVSSYALQTLSELNGQKRNKTLRFGKASSDNSKPLAWDMLQPHTAFELVGSDTLKELADDLGAAEGAKSTMRYKAMEYYSKVRDSVGWKESWMSDAKDITTERGETVKLTTEQRITIYLASKRNQYLEHIEKGGIRVTQAKKYNRPTIVEAQDGPVRLTIEDMVDISAGLTDEQKRYGDELQRYLSGTIAGYGNIVSRVLYGVDRFTERFYWPIMSDRGYIVNADNVADDIEGISLGGAVDGAQRKLKNIGASKDVIEHANNPVVIGNCSTMWINHCSDMINYSAFVLPLENITRVYNYMRSADDESTATGVKSAIRTAHGDAALAYIDKLLSDFNGNAAGRDAAEGLLWRFFGKAKGAAVALNLRVAIQQPSAIPRALLYLDTKSLIRTTLTGREAAEMLEHSPIAVTKTLGGYTIGNRGSHSDFYNFERYKTIKEKLSGLTNADYRRDLGGALPQKMDELTWCHIWNACKLEVKEKQGITGTGADFWAAVDKKFTQVISNTQVYDSIYSRAGIMRAKSLTAQKASAFASEPIVAFNMLFSEIVKSRYGKKSNVGRCIVSLVAAAAMNTMLTGLIDMGRDDDEDQSGIEKYIESTVWNFVESLFLPGSLPYFRDIFSLAKGYKVGEDIGSSLITDLYNAVATLFDGEKSFAERIEQFAFCVSAFSGNPLSNVKRDINAIVRIVTSLFDDNIPTKSGVEHALLSSIGKEKTKDERLYNAIIDGDTEMLRRLKKDYTDDSGNFDEKKYTSAVKSAMRKYDNRVSQAVELIKSGDISGYRKIAEAITADGFDVNLVNDAISDAYTAYASKVENAAKAKNSKDEDAYKKIREEMTQLGYDAAMFDGYVSAYVPGQESGGGLHAYSGMTDALYSAMYAAVVVGDAENYKQIYNMLIEDKYTEGVIKSNLLTLIRENDQRVKTAAEKYMQGNLDAYDDLVIDLAGDTFGAIDLLPELRAEWEAKHPGEEWGEYLIEGIVDIKIGDIKDELLAGDALEGVSAAAEAADFNLPDYIKALDAAAKSTGYKDTILAQTIFGTDVIKNTVVSKTMLNECIAAGDMVNLGLIVDLTYSYGLEAEKLRAEAAGETFDEQGTRTAINSTLVSAQTEYWKPLYRRAYLDGDSETMRDIYNALYAAGIYSQSRLSNTLNGWLQ